MNATTVPIVTICQRNASNAKVVSYTKTKCVICAPMTNVFSKLKPIQDATMATLKQGKTNMDGLFWDVLIFPLINVDILKKSFIGENIIEIT
jgi:hypothetical protein